MTQWSPEGTFRAYLEQKRSAAWMLEEPWRGYFGVLLGLTSDEAVESWRLAARMHHLHDPQSPDDVLPIIAADRRLPQYYAELSDAHRERLRGAWVIYAKGASREAIVDELAAAGWVPDERAELWGEPGVTWGEAGFMWGDRGAAIDLMLGELGPRSEPPLYWSQFRVVLANDIGPAIGPAIPWGVFNWGDPGGDGSGIWGPTGLTNEIYSTLVGIIRHFKPSTHVARSIRFMTSDDVWGGSGDWGAPDAIWGGYGEITLPL